MTQLSLNQQTINKEIEELQCSLDNKNLARLKSSYYRAQACVMIFWFLAQILVNLGQQIGAWRIEWQKIITQNNGPVVCHHRLAFDEKKKIVYLFGGYRNKIGHLNELWGFSIQTKQWWQFDPYGEIPKCRRGHCLTYLSNKLYLFGGFEGTMHFNELFIFDIPQNTWMKQEYNAYYKPTEVRGHDCVMVDGQFLLSFGGYNGEHYLGDMLLYDVVGNHWTRLEALGEGDNLPPAQAQHTLIFDDKRIVLMASAEVDKYRSINEQR